MSLTRDELIKRNPWMTLRVTLDGTTLWEYQVLGHWMTADAAWPWVPNGPDNTISTFMMREIEGTLYQTCGDGVLSIELNHMMTSEKMQRLVMEALENVMKP